MTSRRGLLPQGLTIGPEVGHPAMYYCKEGEDADHN
jgi:hypothetical protein